MNIETLYDILIVGAGPVRLKGTPKPLRERISADLREARAVPVMAERYRALDYKIASAGTPDALADTIRRETTAWAGIIKTANLKLD